jgi:hypothetical protein
MYAETKQRGYAANLTPYPLQRGDSHEIQTVVDSTNTLKRFLTQYLLFVEQGQQNYVQASWNTVDPFIDLTRIHSQSLPTLGLIKQVSS